MSVPVVPVVIESTEPGDHRLVLNLYAIDLAAEYADCGSHQLNVSLSLDADDQTQLRALRDALLGMELGDTPKRDDGLELSYVRCSACRTAVYFPAEPAP